MHLVAREENQQEKRGAHGPRHCSKNKFFPQRKKFTPTHSQNFIFPTDGCEEDCCIIDEDFQRD